MPLRSPSKPTLAELNALQAWRSAVVDAATPHQVLLDYFFGLLVISADFGFKPVIGKTYHLYFRQDRWQLSLVSPAEWRPHRWTQYVAACKLQRDATWVVEPAPGLRFREDLIAALASFAHAFRARLQASACQTTRAGNPAANRRSNLHDA